MTDRPFDLAEALALAEFKEYLRRLLVRLIEAPAPSRAPDERKIELAPFKERFVFPDLTFGDIPSEWLAPRSGAIQHVAEGVEAFVHHDASWYHAPKDAQPAIIERVLKKLNGLWPNYDVNAHKALIAQSFLCCTEARDHNRLPAYLMPEPATA